MKLLLASIVLFGGLFLIANSNADDLSPAVPVVPNIAPEPTLAAPTTDTSPIPGNLEGLANSCHADLNQNNNSDAQLQQLLQSNDTSQTVLLLTNANSCRLFSEKAVITFVMLTPKTNPILRGGIELNSPLASPGGANAFPTQLCQAMCTYSCRPSVGIIFSLAALSHGCTPCANTHPCSVASVL